MTTAPPKRDACGLRIQLLGAFRVSAGGGRIEAAEWPRRKAAGIVKLLALAPRHRLHREQVVDLLWPDFAPDAGLNNLHRTLHVARRVLQPDLTPGAPAAHLRLSGEVLDLCPSGRLSIDVEAFEAAAAVARQADEPAAYEAALRLYTGELLPEDRYDDWATGRRDRLSRLYLELSVELARLQATSGNLNAAISTLQRVVVNDPAHEEAHAILMRLHALAGRRHQALRQYQQLCAALRVELSTEPSADTQRLRQAILAGRVPIQELEIARPPAGAGPPRSAGRNGGWTRARHRDW